MRGRVVRHPAACGQTSSPSKDFGRAVTRRGGAKRLAQPSRARRAAAHVRIRPRQPPAADLPPPLPSSPRFTPAQDDDIPGEVRYRTYDVLKAEAANPRLRWAYLPYSMHMAGPREAIQHMIIRKNYGSGRGRAGGSLVEVGMVPVAGAGALGVGGPHAPCRCTSHPLQMYLLA